MSTNLATVPLAPLPHAPLAPSHVRGIEVVADRAQRRARPKIAYAVTVIGSLGVLMFSQLALSIALSDGAYTIDRLEATQKEQSRTEQLVTEDLGRLSSPQNLAVNAEALGMVQNANPVWLRMSDGAVIGTPIAAEAADDAVDAVGQTVANDLLAGVPLVTQLPANAATSGVPVADAAATAAAQEVTSSATPSAAAGGSDAAQVPSDGQVPAPTTR